MLVDEPRIFDEERAWLQTMIDLELNESDQRIWLDVHSAYNFRDRVDNEQMEPLIYNELILDPATPQQPDKVVNPLAWIQAQEDVLWKLTKAQLIERARAFGLDSFVNKRMLKADIIGTLVQLTH